MTIETFTCEHCGGRFWKGSDQVANAEALEQFGVAEASRREDMAVVCEDCYTLMVQADLPPPTAWGPWIEWTRLALAVYDAEPTPLNAILVRVAFALAAPTQVRASYPNPSIREIRAVVGASPYGH